MTLRHFDLFSGIGGFSLAASWAGFTTVGFSEIDDYCCRVLRKHWPHVPNYGDIRSVPNLCDITLMTGGFPCQPFSTAGKRKGRDDVRHLWPEFYQQILRSRPAWVVAENVVGIVNMELPNVLNDLETGGYQTQSYIIPASAAGAPHRRERVWIVAHADRDRCNHGINSRNSGKILDNFQRDIATCKTDWLNIFPESWSAFDLKEFMAFAADPASGEGRKISQRTDSRDIPGIAWWPDEPRVPGMDDGLSAIVDRNRALGNAIVPQVVYPILRAIALIEGAKHVSYQSG